MIINININVFVGCQSSEGDVYKNNETWREGDCVTCHCLDGKKRCQAEMCVKTCLNPKPVPGRCCPICDGRSNVAVLAIECLYRGYYKHHTIYPVTPNTDTFY